MAGPNQIALLIASAFAVIIAHNRGVQFKTLMDGVIVSNHLQML